LNFLAEGYSLHGVRSYAGISLEVHKTSAHNNSHVALMTMSFTLTGARIDVFGKVVSVSLPRAVSH
jgi:hypothetical protein